MVVVKERKVMKQTRISTSQLRRRVRDVEIHRKPSAVYLLRRPVGLLQSDQQC